MKSIHTIISRVYAILNGKRNESPATNQTENLWKKCFSRMAGVLAVFLFLGGSVWGQTITEITTTGGSSWVCPANVYQVTVDTWGAGGGGASGTSNGYYGGGGGGAYSSSVVTVIPGTTYYYSVGAGGAAGTAGGDSWFNATSTSPYSSNAAPTSTVTGVLAKGGGGVASNITTGATGGVSGSGFGTIKYSGGNAGTGTASGTGGGGGGAGTLGNGGNGGVTAGGIAGAGYGGGDGANGRTTAGNGYGGFERYGSGGSGCRVNNANARTGGAGTQGFIRLTYVAVTASASVSPICASGNSTLSGNTNSTAVTLYSENFERYSTAFNYLLSSTQFVGWKMVGTQNNTRWAINATSPIAGSFSLGLYDSYTSAYNVYYTDGDYYYWYYGGISNNLIAYDNSQKINATNYTNLLMDFNWKCLGEGTVGGSIYDYGMICYSTDGTNWTNITTGGPSGNGRYFGQSATQTATGLALPAALNGQQFWIGFRWINDASTYGNPPFSVDNITITGTPGVSYAWSGGTPTGGSTPTAQTTSVSPTAQTTYNYSLTVGGVVGSTTTVVNITPIPDCVSSASPSGSGQSAAGVTLSWDAVSGATSYDVYFGSDNTPTNIANGTNQSALTYATGALSENTTYYWKVVPKNSCGSAASCSIYSFTTTSSCTPPSITSTSNVNIGCFSQSTGSITVNATSGTVGSGYQYSKDNGTTWQSSDVFGSLAAGSYNIVVKGGDACVSAATSVTLTQPATALSATASGGGSGCAGSTLSLSSSVSGGTSGYSYLWTNAGGLSSGTAANPTATIGSFASHSVTVTDANGCTATSNSVAITNNSPAAPTASNPAAICAGQSANLAATSAGSNQIVWYDAPSGGNVIGTGSNLTVTPSSTQTYYAAATTVTPTVQTFTSSQTFTVPSGVSQVKVEAWGAGGAGGAARFGGTYCWYCYAAGGGGGGGAYSTQTLNVTASQQYTLTIGTGGIGGTTNGPDGGNTSYTGTAGTVTALGGKGGSKGNDGSDGAGGLGGIGTFNGGNGSNAYTWGTYNNAGGGGGGAGNASHGTNASAASDALGGPGGSGGTGSPNNSPYLGGNGANFPSATYTLNGLNGNSPGGGGTGGAGSSANTIGGNGGNGQIVLTYTNLSSGCISERTSATVTVNPAPTASAGAALSAICSGATSAALGGSVGGSATGGTWTHNGSGTLANASNPSTATYTAGASESGTVTLTLTTTGGGCTAVTATKTIVVNPNPTVPTTPINLTICQQGSGNISVTAPTLTSSQNVAFNIATEPTEANAAPGNQIATATISALPSGTTITSAALTVSNLTALGGSYMSEVRLGLSGAVTYSAVAGSSTGAAGGFNYSSSVTSGITVGSGTSLNLLYWDYANDNSGAECTFGAPKAANLTLNYSYPATINWYDASTGGNLLGTGASFNPVGTSVLPNTNTAGTYNFYAASSNNGCESSRVLVTVTITTAPNAGTISGTQAICSNGTTTFSSDGNSGGAWTSASTNYATIHSTSGVITPVAAGTSTITYTITGTGGCSNATATRTVTVTSAPNAGTISGTQAICSNGTTTFSSNGNSGGAWTSSDQAVSTINSTSGVITPVAAGTSTITYTITGTGGCSNATATRTVTVNPPTVAGSISADNSSICSGTGTTLTLSGNTGTIQWQSSTDNVTYATISGETTSALSTGNLTQTKYYKALVTSGACSVASSNVETITVNVHGTYIGPTTGNWNDPANWCGGLPTNATNVVISSGDVVTLNINAETTVATMTIDGSLIVPSTAELTVNGLLTNNGTFTLKDGATFVQGTNGTSITGNGTFNVEKALADNSANWTSTSGRFWYMGVPMVSVARSGFGTAGATTNRLWYYTEATKQYTELSTGTTLLSAGTGYVYRRSTDGTITFTAVGANGLYRSDQTISGLTKTAGYTSGCNLVSNPYMAYLDWDLVSKTNIEPTFYIRTNNTSSGDISALISYNSETHQYTNNSSVTINNASQISHIAPMQSIWVRVVAGATTGSLGITRGMLTHQSGNVGLKSSTVFPTLARVNLVDGNRFDQMLVYLNSDMSNEVDQYDSEKLPVSGIVQLYTMSSNKKLVMNGLKNNKKKVSVPLYLELPTTKSYTLQLSEFLLDDGLILLEDKQEGTLQDFTLLGNYTFFANSGVLSNRFVLHFILPDATITAQGANNDWLAPQTSYTEGGNVQISSDSKGSIQVIIDQPEDQKVEGTVFVTDMNGKEVYKGQLDGNVTEFELNVPSGIYYLTVQSGTLIEKKKVFIQE